MILLKEGKTNWRYILIVVILAAVVGGGILTWQFWWTLELKTPEINIKEACEKAGGDLCEENEVCLTSMIDLEEIGRCCSMNCITPQKATTENMVLIPAGTFLMGREDREGWSPMANPQIFNDELPSHEVYVDAFYIDKYEVTNRQFKEFVDATGYVTDAERNGGSTVIVSSGQADEVIQGTYIGFKWIEGASWRTPEGPNLSIENLMDYPVVHVSWNDANAYARWTGKRLPTEAEWEKAARGGTNTNWFWGDELDSAGQYANMYSEHRWEYIYPKEVIDGYLKTAPVGSLLPNGYGLYDTAGNVWEWVSDWYQYDYFTNNPINNPKGPETGEDKVVKGGGWYLCECYLRPANREPRGQGDYDHGIGFRLALDTE